MLGRLFACLLLSAALSGCRTDVAPHVSDESDEPALESQIENVRSGASDRIQVENQPVTNNDLARIGELTSLAALLLDHSENTITDRGLEHLRPLASLVHLRIRGATITDSGIAPLLELRELRILNLPRADLTGAGLEQLQQLPKLEQLRITSPRLGDADLAVFKDFPSLKRVHLIDVPITDEGLKVFVEMPQLESLYIDGGRASDAAYEALFQANPKIHVHVDQQHHDRDPNRHEH